LNCRYCGQWNPDEAARCSFCANAKDGLEDATVAPRATSVQAAATLPAPPGEPALPDPLQVRGQDPELRRALRHAEHTWAMVGGIVTVLVGLLYLLGRCS
jgi:hypothetical protein